MGNATSMAELLAKSKSNLKSYKKGENVTGKITKLSSSEILVDIGAKTEAQVLEKDRNLLKSILENLKVGDSVNAYVLNPESDQGNPVVSLRRFMEEKLWVKLDKLVSEKKVMKVTISEQTKGGFLVTAEDGLSGFLPNSQTMISDNASSLVGQKVEAVVLEINKELHKIIFSQKGAMNDEDYSKLTSTIKVGDQVDAVINNATGFGIFVSIQNANQNIEGFIHLSELSWERIETAEGIYKNGEKIKAQIIGIDIEAKRVNLSVKRLTKDPFEEYSKNFSVDKKVKGVVKTINSQGLIIDLGEIEGLVKKEKLPPSVKYNSGDSIDLTVTEIDLKRHKIVLTPVLKEKPIGYR